MLRVLVVGFCAVPGPERASVQLGHVIRAVARRASVDVLAARRGEQPYVERRPRVRILRVPVPDAPLAERTEAFRRALRRQLEGADYDVVHVRDGFAASVVLELRHRLGYAVVFDAARAALADPAAVEPEALAGILDIERACVREADIVLAPTEPARRYLAALTRSERVMLAPPGVDVDCFDWDDPPQGQSPRILYLGAVAPARGVRLLLRAMMEVTRRVDARVVLAGPTDPEFRARMLDYARALGIFERIEFHGEVAHEDVPDLIARATICVAPTAADLSASPAALFPTKLLESMACRRVVVAARQSAATLLVRERDNGLLFTPGDPGDLADQLRALLADAEARGRLADAGYEYVRRHYSASNTRRCLRRAYDALAASPGWRDHFARAAARDERYGGDPAFAGALVMPRLGGDEELEVGEPFADDITAVEAPSFTAPEVGLDDGLVHGVIGEDTGEDWVIEDSLSREHGVGAAPPRRDAARDRGPVENVFVAGVLELPDAISDGDEPSPFSAAGPLLGGGDETDHPRAGPPRGIDGADDDD